MMWFNHPNVMRLIGVCIDVGEAPYIVMPFMGNGSLLAYLKKKRSCLTINEEAEGEMVYDCSSCKIIKFPSYKHPAPFNSQISREKPGEL